METKVTLDGRGVSCIYKVDYIIKERLARTCYAESPWLSASSDQKSTQAASAVPPMLWYQRGRIEPNQGRRLGGARTFLSSPGAWEPDLSSLSTLSPTPYAAVSLRFCVVTTISLYLLFLETLALRVTRYLNPRYHLFFSTGPCVLSDIHHLSSFTYIDWVRACLHTKFASSHCRANDLLMPWRNKM